MTHLSIFSQQYSLNNTNTQYLQSDDLQLHQQQSSFHLNSRKSSIDFFSKQSNNTLLTAQQKKDDEFEIEQFMNFDIDAQSLDLMKNDSFSSSDKVFNPLNVKKNAQIDAEYQSPFTLSNKIDQQQQQIFDEEEKNAFQMEEVKQKIFKVQKSTISKKNKISKNYDKNICRYLTRKTIRCFAKNEYKQQGLIFTNGDENLWFDATDFFLRKIEQITGFRVLKEYLNYQQEQDETIRSYKRVFKQFYIWFLKNRISRYILNGSMENKSMYLKYKNEVMLSYYESLDDWTSNKNKKILKRKIKK